MKTLKQLFKTLLYGEKTFPAEKEPEMKNEPEKENEREHDAPKVLNNPINSPNKISQDERKTDENPGNHELAAPLPTETDPTPEELQPTLRGMEAEGCNPEKEVATGITGERGGEPAIETSEYQRGFIDGRNQKIEEMFFPKYDDGVPHFRGTPTPQSPSIDIFSLAREA